MVREIACLGLLTAFWAGSVITAGHQTGALTIRIYDLESNKGSLQLAGFDGEESFLQPGAHRFGKTISLPRQGSTVTVEVPDLPFGRYALAVYHDLNNNGVLDTNLFGVPVEPYAFSNNPTVKWRSPRFEEVRFDFRHGGQVEEVRLMRWKER